MRSRIKRVAEQAVDPRPAKFARRQGDAMYDDELRHDTGRARIAVGRRELRRAAQQAGGNINTQDWPTLAHLLCLANR